MHETPSPHAAFAARVLACDDRVDVERAYRRFVHRRALAVPAREPARRVTAFALAGALAMLALVVLATPIRTYATALFRELRPTRFAAWFVPSSDPRKAFEESSLGQIRRATTYRRTSPPLRWTRTPIGTASSRAGYHVRVPAIVPHDLYDAGDAYIAAPSSWQLRFDTATAQDNGLRLPRSLDGATISSRFGSQVEIRYGRGTVYRIGPFGAPVLVVYETPVPAIAVRGAALGAIARWFASEPSVPPDAARQMRSFEDPLPAIPVPVRIDRDRAQHVAVDGAEGLAVTMPLAQSSGVVWEKGGMVYAVGGTYGLDRILEIANSLR